MTTKDLKPGDKLRCPDGKVRTISYCTTIEGEIYILFEEKELAPRTQSPGWQMCPDIKWQMCPDIKWLLEGLK